MLDNENIHIGFAIVLAIVLIFIVYGNFSDSDGNAGMLIYVLLGGLVARYAITYWYSDETQDTDKLKIKQAISNTYKYFLAIGLATAVVLFIMSAAHNQNNMDGDNKDYKQKRDVIGVEIDTHYMRYDEYDDKLSELEQRELAGTNGTYATIGGISALILTVLSFVSA